LDGYFRDTSLARVGANRANDVRTARQPCVASASGPRATGTTLVARAAADTAGKRLVLEKRDEDVVELRPEHIHWSSLAQNGHEHHRGNT